MNHPIDDPKLTAYALGELDESEAEAVETQLAASDEARKFVDEVRATARLLAEELRREPAPHLAESQRGAIEKELAGKSPGTLPKPIRRWARPVVTLAVAAACVGVTVALLMSATRSARESARVAGRAEPLREATAEYQAVRDELSARRALPASEPHGGAAGTGIVHFYAGEAAESKPAKEALARSGLVYRRDSRQLGEPAGGQRHSLLLEQRQESIMPAIKAQAQREFGVAVAGREARGRGLERTESEGVSRRLQPGGAGLEQQTKPRMSRLADLGGGGVGESLVQDAFHNTEAYDPIVDNPFLAVAQNPLSTFSIDVDTASYANVRRFLLAQGQRPPKDAVRIEELVNYFRYDYAPPSDSQPFAVHLEAAGCPWNPEHRLLRVGLKAREIPPDRRPPSNLVFLIDVSGSMQPANKLPLVKRALKMLVENLGENDRIAMVVYASATGLVLPATTGAAKETILDALDRLQAGGSTAGGAGIQLAYEVAVANFLPGGANRVLLCTDGDFNVGITHRGDLVRLIEAKAKSGVFLSVLGFGMGNLKDATMEQLADKGNGHYAYIDSEAEARKVLVDELGGTLVTIAKDVKIQVEFNPAKVGAYRLIGYENRLLRAEDFHDDAKDAGEIGAGHSVTALYELVPADKPIPLPGVDPLKYQKPAVPANASPELLTIKLRYKPPAADKSQLLEQPLVDAGKSYAQASGEFKFAAAVASFGMLLRESPYKGNATYASVLELAQEGLGPDPSGRRAQFLELVKKAQSIAR
jgi:Ca-activated chloride channel family protein